MEDMKADMTGAAVVLATMQAVARLGLPVNLVGYLALTENMTGGRAMKLGDVLTMRNGKTVEVLNTDAEGRLILADALSYAAEGKPARILDLATLTGACMVALGTKIAGLFSNDDPFAEAVLAACRRTGERAWRLPLDDDFQEPLKSHVADLKNVGGKWGGAITAAKFLQQFVGETPWVHLDIAGPSWADSDGATRDAGGTGCFVRTLVALVEASATMRTGPEGSRVGADRRIRSAGGEIDQDWRRRSCRRHSIRRLLMSSVSRISRTSSIGRSLSMAQFRMSRFSWPALSRSRISSMRRSLGRRVGAGRNRRGRARSRRSALEVLEPAFAEEPVPVVADPAADRPVAQVAAGLLALDPLVPLGLGLAPLVDAESDAGPDDFRSHGLTLAHRDLRARDESRALSSPDRPRGITSPTRRSPSSIGRATSIHQPMKSPGRGEDF